MKKTTRMLKKIPTFRTDEEAEDFVATADLSEYDLRGQRVRFEFEPKDSRINMRLPRSFVTALKEGARKRGIPYQRYMREMMELGMAQEKRK